MSTPQLLLVLAALCVAFALSAPTTSDDLVVVVSTITTTPTTPSQVSADSADRQADGASKGDGPQLRSMHVQSNVTNRYGRTVVSSRYVNPHNTAREATFSIVLPDAAFITGFVMVIKDVPYEAYVREKEEARREYDHAVSTGQTAAHVELSARDSNRFSVSVNVEPHAKVVFNLTYEQLLVRRHGHYELVLNLHPSQLVKHFTVAVNVNETGRLLNLSALPLRSGNELKKENENARPEVQVHTSADGRSASVLFEPSVEQQKQLAMALGSTADDAPLAGQMVVRYDVERTANGGELLYGDGYFVHFFAPDTLQPLPKHVVFVLDLSGSMLGRKVTQLRQAMKHILAELNPDDYFHLVEFSTGVKVWDLENASHSFRYQSPKRSDHGWWGTKVEDGTSQSQNLPAAASASQQHILRAQQIVEEMSDWGGTNIHDALIVALNLTGAGVPGSAATIQPVVVFLTDGDATVGEVRTGAMLEAAAAANRDGASIFALSFGDDANKSFLKKLSLQNGGFSRHIYEAADAALQLQDFYREISSPLLSNVTFKYDRADQDSLTRHTFRTLFGGSELVVAGRVKDQSDKQDDKDTSSVHALTRLGPLDFIPHITFKPETAPTTNKVYGPLERLWAYISVRQLLDKRDAISDADSKEAKELRNDALKLALKYSFVTPVTSLVVVKPNETRSVDTEVAKPNALPQFYDSMIMPASHPGIAVPQSISFNRGGGASATAGFSSIPGIPRQPANNKHAAVHAFRPSSSYPHSFSEDALESSGVHHRYPPTTTIRLSPISTTAPTRSPLKNPIAELSWLGPLLDGVDSIQFEGKHYALGNNATTVEHTTCTVPSLSGGGNCTLLSMCPQVYPELHDLETYKIYFCSLEHDRYAGVCCVTKPDVDF